MNELAGSGLAAGFDVHHGRADVVQENRSRVLADAYATHPERFVRHPPVPLALPETAWINPPQPDHPNSTINPDQ